MSPKLRGVVFDYNLFHEERDDGDVEATSDVAVRLSGLALYGVYLSRVFDVGFRVSGMVCDLGLEQSVIVHSGVPFYICCRTIDLKVLLKLRLADFGLVYRSRLIEPEVFSIVAPDLCCLPLRQMSHFNPYTFVQPYTLNPETLRIRSSGNSSRDSAVFLMPARWSRCGLADAAGEVVEVRISGSGLAGCL